MRTQSTGNKNDKSICLRIQNYRGSINIKQIHRTEILKQSTIKERLALLTGCFEFSNSFHNSFVSKLLNIYSSESPFIHCVTGKPQCCIIKRKISNMLNSSWDTRAYRTPRSTSTLKGHCLTLETMSSRSEWLRNPYRSKHCLKTALNVCARRIR